MPDPGELNKPSDVSAHYSRDLIEKEIAHLKKGRSVREAHETRRGWWRTLGILLVLAVVWLYVMDPFLFSYNRGDAIRVYLYLHNYGDDREAAAVGACGLLKPGEVRALERRQGAFQDYYNGTKAAEARAKELIRYMQAVQALHQGRYSDLSPVNKLRYYLFIKTGLIPPISWNSLNSPVESNP